jgi:hypothetical protein
MDYTFIRGRPNIIRNIQRIVRNNFNLSDGSHACIENKLLGNIFLLLNRIGSGSINGEAFSTCFPVQCDGDGQCECQDNPMYLAIKKIPLSNKDYLLSKNPLSKESLTSELWGELLAMRLCNALVENKVTPNLPLYVNYFLCNDCDYENDALVMEYPAGSRCVILVNELANAGDIKNWSKVPRSNDEWLNAYFQIFSAIYAIQKYFDMSHHDLHWGNVLVHQITPGGFWRYTIDGIVYDVPNMGWLFTLWDFGYARIPGKLEISQWKEMYSENQQNPRLLVDYYRISNVPIWRNGMSGDEHVPISPQMQNFINTITMMFQQGQPIQSLVSTWKEIYPTNSEFDPYIIDHYSFDKRLNMDHKLYQFMRTTTRRAMLPTRSQIEAQVALRNELQYDDRVLARRKMIKFMQTYSDIGNDITFNPLKEYFGGDIVQLDGYLYIAKNDFPEPNEWDELGPADDYDITEVLDSNDNILPTHVDNVENVNNLDNLNYNPDYNSTLDGLFSFE